MLNTIEAQSQKGRASASSQSYLLPIGSDSFPNTLCFLTVEISIPAEQPDMLISSHYEWPSKERSIKFEDVTSSSSKKAKWNFQIRSRVKDNSAGIIESRD